MIITQLDEFDLLRGMVIAESVGEDFMGNVLVAQVVKERLKDKRWPSSWRPVILQPKQFSCFNAFSRIEPLPQWAVTRFFSPDWKDPDFRECHFAAWGVFYDWIKDDFGGGANHYWSDDISTPSWAVGRTPLYKWGKHFFLKL